MLQHRQTKVKYFLILLLLLTLSCSPLNKTLKTYNISEKDIVIFVPGYKGSELADIENQNTVWLSLSELVLGTHTLDLNNSKLVATNPLSEINIVPHIYSIDIYNECLSNIESSLANNFTLIPFYYDWRKSNFETSEKLESYINNIRKNKPRSISIIAHSMGGLSVALLKASNKIDDIRKIIFLGTLFRGTTTAFLDMNRELESILFNTTLLSREVFMTFESAYEVLPHPEDRSFYDSDLTNADTIYNLNFWKDFSLLANKLDYAYLESSLSRAALLFNKLSLKTKCDQTEILNIQGTNLNTPEELSSYSTFNNIIKIIPHSGDGLVSEKSSSLPPSLLACKNEQLKFKNLVHDRICNDPRAFNAMMSFISY